jgi:excisionase family DNA binding protein
MEEASTRLAVSHKIVRRLIEAGKIPATQVVPCAPWEISAEAVESKTVLEEIERIKQRGRPLRATSVEELPMFAEI